MALVCLFIPCGPLTAQYGLYTARSLEWQVASSTAIVRGTVVDVEPAGLPQEEGWWIVTLSVRETLKGRAGSRPTLAFFTGRENDILQRWKASAEERLWFLREPGGRSPGVGEGVLQRDLPEAVLRRHRTGYYAPDYLWSAVRIDPVASPDPSEPPPPFLNLELRAVRTPEEIIRAVRQAADYDRGRPVPVLHRLGVPHPVLAQAGRVGDVNEIVVPVDGRLEKLARRLIRSPADFTTEPRAAVPEHPLAPETVAAITRSNQDTLRATGVRALRYFRSSRNIQLLKSLLRDPATLLITGAPHEQVAAPAGRNGHRVYYLRAAAYEVLRQWGVSVGKPVLRADP